MPLLFATTLFLSAVLLFWVQPLIAKLLLPLLGGAPAVWNTCMVFFQTMLLAGYAYAHGVTNRLSFRHQALAHLALLALAAHWLPLEITDQEIRALGPETNPAFWLLGSLLLVAGLPCFIVSSSAPLLQQWFSQTGHASAKDPYFLYSASNLGSLIALLGFPVIMEPHWRLQEQTWLWTAGYGGLVILVGLCAMVMWRRQTSGNLASKAENPPARSHSAPNAQIVSIRRKLRWLALSFVPSSLMLGVTNYLTTDIASIPMMWVVPLAIYLLTYILVFARTQWLSRRLMARALPMGALGLTFLILTRTTQVVWLMLLVNLLVLFLAAMVCHGRLAEDRPPREHLTDFYFWMSLGGVLGGVFNALIAPVTFNTLVEYPLAIVLACLLRPGEAAMENKPACVPLDFAMPVLLGFFTACLALMVTVFDWESAALRNAIIIGVPAVFCYTFVDRPLRFGLGLGAVFVGGWFYAEAHGQILHVERNFFGVSRVAQEPNHPKFRHFIHGNTVHGRQFLDPRRCCEPSAYYHPTGPIGNVIEAYNARPSSPRVAVIGLGTGSLMTFAAPNQTWTFYEIDPAVIRIARDTNFFTYLERCAKTQARLVVGDARLRLREAPDGHYGLIVMDAFSSDAVPVHLLTRQALELYLSKLARHGLLVFHISNRYLDLAPVVGDLALDAQVVGLGWDDTTLTPEDSSNGKEQSYWVVLARQRDDLGALVKNPVWLPVKGRVKPHVWTDDFSNILSVFRWR